MTWFAGRVLTAAVAALSGVRFMVMHPIVLVVATIPAAIRVVQALRSELGDSSIVFEGVVGAMRVALAMTIVAAAAGWSPPSGATLDTSTLGAAWTNDDVDVWSVVIDVGLYAALYGMLNWLVVGRGEHTLIMQLIGERVDQSAADAIVFAIKNLLVIPVATIHLLWALRIIPLVPDGRSTM